MTDVEAIKDRLRKEGYSVINEYNDPAGEFFSDHIHPVDEHLIVVTGNISVDMDGKHYECGVADELFFPANMIHSAKIGPEGCLYIVGEKPSV